MGEIHRVACEGDGDGRSQAQRPGVFGGHRQGHERIVLGLEREGTVVADVFEGLVEGAGGTRIFQRGGGVDVHVWPANGGMANGGWWMVDGAFYGTMAWSI